MTRRFLHNARRSALNVHAIDSSWAQDSQILARYKAGSFSDLAPVSVLGPLTQVGGSVTTTAGVIDGQPAWQFTRAAGIYLRTTNHASTDLRWGPYTLIVIARSTGSPVNNDVLISGAGFGDSRILWNTAAQWQLSGAAFTPMPCTTANFNMLTWYHHSTASRFSVNNAAYSAPYNGQGNHLTGLNIGANSDGTLSSGSDVAEVIIVEGQPSAALLAGITGYIRTTYPSIAVSATPPVAFSVDTVSLGGLISGSFDVIPALGQSNNNCMTSAATQAPGANTFMLRLDGTLQPLAANYCVVTFGILDPVQGGPSGIGGNGTSLANAYTAGTGRPVVLVPCASLGAGYYPVAVSNSTNWLDPGTSPYSRNKLRNTIYGSTLARIKSLIALGGTLRFGWYYQGEEECVQGGTFVTNWAAKVLAMLRALATDLGMAPDGMNWIIQPVANTCNGATAPNIAAMQAAATTLALAGKRIIMPPYAGAMEADNLHVNNTGQDAIGAAVAAAALAQTAGTGWF